MGIRNIFKANFSDLNRFLLEEIKDAGDKADLSYANNDLPDEMFHQGRWLAYQEVMDWMRDNVA